MKKTLSLITILFVLSGCASAQRREFFGIKTTQEIIDSHPEWDSNIKQAILAGHPLVGMNYDQVKAVWGKSYTVNTTMTGSTRYEQVCFSEYLGRYAYFENGVLTSYQERK